VSETSEGRGFKSRSRHHHLQIVQPLQCDIMYEIEISNWDELSIYFSKVFNNLGYISIDEKYLTFSSFPEDVKTELIIHRTGQLVANMPLHGVDTFIQIIRIDEKMEIIELIGPNIEYQYRIPPQLLLRR